MTAISRERIEEIMLEEMRLSDAVAGGLRVAAEVEERMRAEQDDTRERLKVAIARTTRLTNLLRQTLPEADQHGCGLDGMIESLLAKLVSLLSRAESAERERDELKRQLAELASKADTVMKMLDEHGPSIVPHLVDTDENPGEWLRDAVRRALGEEES